MQNFTLANMIFNNNLKEKKIILNYSVPNAEWRCFILIGIIFLPDEMAAGGLPV